MIELKVNQTIRGLFAGLDEREIYDELEKDIQKRGILVKGVVANSPEEYKGTIVCGDKRHSIASKLQVEFPYILVDFKSFEEMMEYAKNDNILRRQLTPAQRIKVESNFIEWLQRTRQENQKNGTLL
jgi:ParB-like chromosome segregation protein Spo0J